jgi:hypothetical protein
VTGQGRGRATAVRAIFLLALIGVAVIVAERDRLIRWASFD